MNRQIQDQKHFFREWSKRTGLSQRELVDAYSEMIDILVESANDSDQTKTIIPEIGVLEVKPEDMRKRRNPRTNQIVVTEPTRKAHIRLYPRLKNRFKPDELEK
ncbi:DNA-binding protein [Staphylococcus phage Machias]|nr:DNA-binding protein [Staphylococcus phage Machias]WPH64178.1 DNA-binding protein [Staphylococcus phage vB_StaM_PB50]